MLPDRLCAGASEGRRGWWSLIGDPAAICLEGTTEVRDGSIRVDDRSRERKRRNKLGRELRMHREQMHMDAELSIGFSEKPQFHNNCSTLLSRQEDGGH